MPIEIKEMHINIKVNYGSAAPLPRASSGKKQVKEAKEDSKERLEEYYEAVLDQINHQKER